MALYIELTEFFKKPITTGIQRVAGELCKHMPPGAAIPVLLGENQYLALPGKLIDLIGRYFKNPSEDRVAEIKQLSRVDNGTPVRLGADDIVLVPEVIIEPRRVEFLETLPAEELKQHRFIVYDLLPITHPEFFRTPWLIEICGYYRVLRRAPHCAFISEATREDFYGRLKRTNRREGVVLPLGSNGLGPRGAKTSAKEKPLNFSVLGTIEPRKNHRLILEAFKPLLRGVPGMTLSFMGSMGWVDADFAQQVQAMASDKDSGLRFLPSPDDETIRREVENSRATVYLSLAEGYGLPPVESLWLGTPVIASRAIPSLQAIGDPGVYYVDPLRPEVLRKAVLAFLNDDYAHKKSREAANLELPTWQNFAHETLQWCLSPNRSKAEARAV